MTGHPAASTIQTKATCNSELFMGFNVPMNRPRGKRIYFVF
jgi:hypothetical protein